MPDFGTRVTVRIDDRALMAKLSRFPGAIDEASCDALEECGTGTVTEAVRLIETGSKSGRLYRRGGGRVHQASAPGESPASDTGNLVKNIISELERNNKTVYVVANTIYAFWLEFGTRLMAARPFLNRAVEALNNFYKETFIRVLRARIRRFSGGGV
jgi:HK97 gp10 family phage protein